ncbi:coiled-coil domain-containing protein 148-like isoform X2 [Hoplias malabaricus]|uniref:coiled-coil domain-containing protein 148-like isoform X2 n=1 Tax=Hoplias malabaricus TaxID=27720 RepID=UPI00346230FB
MSGRDLRAFLVCHRAEDTEKLTQRMKNGLGLSKYKPVRYDELQAMLEAKRLSSEHIEHKVRKTLRAAQERKESSLMRQHKHVWTAEAHRLDRAREKAEADISNFLTRSRLVDQEDGDILKLRLEQEREGFQLATVDPVCQLREDLLYRMTSVAPATNQHAECEQVLQQVVLVKEQQQMMMDMLEKECLSLQQELAVSGLEASLDAAAVEECVAALVKLPEEVLTTDCPYSDLKLSLITAFHSLSDKCTQQLETVRNRLLAMGRNCGWCEEDHLRFLYTVCQYCPQLRNHTALCMDMLHRVLPHISTSELSAHGRLWDWYRFNEDRVRLLLENWRRDRSELLLRALELLEEARFQHREQQNLQNSRTHQQHICAQLRHKVQQWREKQDEVARLEAAIAARWEEEEKERERGEQEREHAKRNKQKQRVREFQEEQCRRRAEWRRREEKRLTQLRREMEEQAQRDKERVQFRENLLEQRKQEQESKIKLKQREEEEREERLSNLRNQVAVVAEADPERMMAQTESWRVRLQPEKEEFTLQKPLYQLYTYTDTQIIADPRVRIEQALRTAGLHNSPYAKAVLSEIKPPKPPRRDTESSVLKS